MPPPCVKTYRLPSRPSRTQLTLSFESPSLDVTVRTGVFRRRSSPVRVPIQRPPSLSSLRLTTLSSVRPSGVAKLDHLSSVSRKSPCPFVPAQTLPSRSSSSAEMKWPFMGRVSASSTMAPPFSFQSPARLPIHSVPARSCMRTVGSLGSVSAASAAVGGSSGTKAFSIDHSQPGGNIVRRPLRKRCRALMLATQTLPSRSSIMSRVHAEPLTTRSNRPWRAR